MRKEKGWLSHNLEMFVDIYSGSFLMLLFCKYIIYNYAFNGTDGSPALCHLYIDNCDWKYFEMDLI